MKNLKKKLSGILNSSEFTLTPVGGGCINEAFKLALKDGKIFFLKTHGSPPQNMYLSEAEGLKELSKANSFRIPQVIHADEQFLLMEYIEPGSKISLKSDFYSQAGKMLAKTHRFSSEKGFGFYHDNFCGSTPQENTWTGDWATFWKNRRLGPQIRLAKDYLNQETRSEFHKLYKNLSKILGATEEDPSSLLHGDLWGGNHFADEAGRPVIMDPAAYYGHREADLAMTTLFGGYPSEFLSSYEKEFPLSPGYWEKRIHLYQLYHLLNHLNLFGSSYLSGVKNKLQILNESPA